MNKIMHESLFIVLSCSYGLCFAANRYTMVAERTELRNILISDNIFHKTECTSVLDCFRQCNDNKSCLSISYHGGTHSCFLYSSFNLNKTGKSEEGWCSYSGEYCPESTGYTYKPSTSICFKFNKAYVNYTQADSLCTSEGATLIRIDSVEKLNEVYYHLIEHNLASEYSYIQGKRQGITSFKWVFDDGTDMNYLPWAISQPDNDVDQDHLIMSGSESGLWHDAATHHLVSYICEKILS